MITFKKTKYCHLDGRYDGTPIDEMWLWECKLCKELFCANCSMKHEDKSKCIFEPHLAPMYKKVVIHAN